MELLKSVKVAMVVSGLALTAACGQKADNTMATTANTQNGIIGGTDVQAGEPIAKSTVLLQFFTQNAKGEVSGGGCTGTLLRQDIVLTAAHCVPQAEEGSRVAMVAVFAVSETLATKENVTPVTISFVHPSWGKETAKVEVDVAVKGVEQKATQEDETDPNSNDFAILKLKTPAPAGYVPAKILMDETPLLKEGVEVVIAGYGLNDDIKKTGDGHLKKAKSHVLALYGDSELVTDQSRGQSVCSGDSGGPAFLEVNGQLYLWGVASRVGNPSNREAYCSGVAIHGRVVPQAQFIMKAIKTIDDMTKKAAAAGTVAKN